MVDIRAVRSLTRASKLIIIPAFDDRFFPVARGDTGNRFAPFPNAQRFQISRSFRGNGILSFISVAKREVSVKFMKFSTVFMFFGVHTLQEVSGDNHQGLFPE